MRVYRVSLLLLAFFLVSSCAKTLVKMDDLADIHAYPGGEIQNFNYLEELEKRNLAALTTWPQEIENRNNYGIYTHIFLCETYLILRQKPASDCLSDVISKIKKLNHSKLYLERFTDVTRRNGTKAQHIAAWPSQIMARAQFLKAKQAYVDGKPAMALTQLTLAQYNLTKTLELGGYKDIYIDDGVTLNEKKSSSHDFNWPLANGDMVTLHGNLIGTGANWQEDFLAVPALGAALASELDKPTQNWISALIELDTSQLIQNDSLMPLEKGAYLRIAYANIGDYSSVNDQEPSYFDAYNHFIAENATWMVPRQQDSGFENGLRATAMAIPLVGLVSLSVMSYQMQNVNEIHRLKRKQGIKLLEKLALARKHHETGSESVALEHYQALLSDPFSGLMPEVTWQAHHHLARLLQQKGNQGKAVEHWQQAINLIDQSRSGDKSGYISVLNTVDPSGPYAHIVQSLINLDRIPEAYRYMEKSKSRKLMDALINVSLKDQDQKVVTRFEKLKKQLAYFRKEANKAAFDKTLRKLSTFSSELQENTPALYDILTAGDAELSTVQSKLSRDETLIVYYESLKDIYAFVISYNSVDVKKVDSTALAQRVKSYRRDISDPETLDVSSKAYLQASAQLYDQIFRPISSMVKGSSLTIVPHGALHYLPFNTLYDGQQFLIERYPIRNLPTSAALVFLENKTINNHGVAAFGNPTLDLPAAEFEARLIAMQAKGKLFVRQNATETEFRKNGQTAKIIHIASHGEFNQAFPLESRLLLAKDAKNDGNVTARELYGMELRNDLVTLSGCETGLGDITEGDDVVGLSRALLFAGARSIVSSLWKVEDQATAQLMSEFYSRSTTSDRMTSLRDAQLTVKNEYNSHPFFWAAFQLTGSVN